MESDLFITSMITDRIGRHEVLLPINHKNYNLGEKEELPRYEKGKFHTVCIVGCLNVIG